MCIYAQQIIYNKSEINLINLKNGCKCTPYWLSTILETTWWIFMPQHKLKFFTTITHWSVMCMLKWLLIKIWNFNGRKECLVGNFENEFLDGFWGWIYLENFEYWSNLNKIWFLFGNLDIFEKFWHLKK